MHPPNHRPTEMYLGTSDVRRDLLRREARGRRQARPGRARIATLAAVVLLVFLVFAAVVVVGPGKAIDWLGTYVFPVAVILAVGLFVLVLLVGWLLKIPFPRGWDRD